MAGITNIGALGERTAPPASNPLPSPPAGFARELARQTAVRTAPATTVVDKVTTHLSGSEAATALKSAWQTTFHETPRPEQLSVLVAQWSHETGGGRAMMNYNFGGIKGTGPSGLTAAYRTTEGYGDTERKITDHFRAYRAPGEGAADYLRLLKDRFPSALDAAGRGDAAGFVKALKNGGYFTGSLEDYTRSVTQLTAQARTEGYDAVGRSAPHAPGPSVSPSPRAPDFSFPLGNEASTREAPLAAIDALSMADELSRAALRIAAGSDDW